MDTMVKHSRSIYRHEVPRPVHCERTDTPTPEDDIDEVLRNALLHARRELFMPFTSEKVAFLRNNYGDLADVTDTQIINVIEEEESGLRCHDCFRALDPGCSNQCGA